MSEVLFVLRWLLLIVLLWSACMAERDLLHLKAGFSPVVTICAIGLVVYFGGLFGVLRPVTFFVYAMCFLCLGRVIEEKRKEPIVWAGIPLIEGGFLLGMLAFFWILYHGSLVHYDNFTHWALVVKEMLITNAIPTEDSLLITFNNYPTGVASWIYFVCTLVGTGENSMIMAQGLLIFAGLFAIYGVIEERGRFLPTGVLTTGLCLLTLFNFSVRINNLLVDFLLPVLTLAAISIIFRYRREPESLYLLPIMGFLMVVKSTGIIYATLAMSYLVYTLVNYAIHNDLVGNHRWDYKGLSKLWGRGVISLGLSVLPFLCWEWHIARTFSHIDHKFDTDLAVVADGVGKTQAEVAQICSLYWGALTDHSQRATMGIFVFEFLAIVACIVGCVVLKKRWTLPKVFLVMNVVLVTYLLGILAMYVLSMPMNEAVELAAFDRYASSIVVLFGGTLSICLAVDMEHSFYYRLGEVEEIRSFKTVGTKYLYLRCCGLCVVLIALLLTSEYNGMTHQEDLYHHSLAAQVKEVVGDNWAEPLDQSQYLVIADDDEGAVSNHYLGFVSKYYLRAPEVDILSLFYEDNFLNLLSQYDYLVIVESTEHTQMLMGTYLGLSGAPGVYDLSEILATKA